MNRQNLSFFGASFFTPFFDKGCSVNSQGPGKRVGGVGFLGLREIEIAFYLFRTHPPTHLARRAASLPGGRGPKKIVPSEDIFPREFPVLCAATHTQATGPGLPGPARTPGGGLIFARGGRFFWRSYVVFHCIFFDFNPCSVSHCCYFQG